MKRRFTEDSWRKEPWMRYLCQVIASLKTEEDAGNFLRDVATLSELQAMSERLEVARLLSKGLSYRQVAAQTGASTTTVTRVAHFLENGTGGYRKVLHTHRHHRMGVLGKGHDAVQNVEEQKPVAASVLEKYLGKKITNMESTTRHGSTGSP